MAHRSLGRDTRRLWTKKIDYHVSTIKQTLKVIFVVMIIFRLSLQDISAQQHDNEITLSGSIYNSDNVIIPFASIFVRELLTGTVSNAEGVYSIKLPRGDRYQIIVQATGYAPKTIDIEATDNIQTDIILEKNKIITNDTNNSENGDYANDIMRHAIINTPLHLNEVERYTANMYIKGSLYVYKIPQINIGKINEKLPQAGRTYTIESINRLEYTSPNKYTQTTLAERSLLPQILIDSDIRLKYFNFNFYNISNNDVVISPLSPHAFLHYKFEYSGYSESFGLKIHHIKVKPRINSKQLFEGTIFIVDKSWQLAHIDLLLETAIGDINVVQNFVPIEHELWLPVFQDYTLDLSLLGIIGQFNYIGATEYTEVKFTTSETSLRNALKIDDDKLSTILGIDHPQKIKRYKRNAQKLTEILDSEHLTNASLKKSGRYWRRITAISDTTKNKLEITDRLKYTILDSVQSVNNIDILNEYRQIPLTTLEINSFNESEPNNREKKKQDDAKSSRSIFGEQNIDLCKGVSATLSALNANMIYYHPVTGVGLEQELSIKMQHEKAFCSVGFKAGYAFSAKQFLPEANVKLSIGKNSFTYAVGNSYIDWKGNTGDPRFTNSLASFFAKKNHKILVNNHYQHYDFDTEPAWGMKINASMHYNEYTSSQNNTNFSILKNKKDFKPNIPQNDYINDKSLSNGSQAVVGIAIEYTPRLRYYTDKEGKRVAQDSRWPTFWTQYRCGIGNTSEDAKSNFSQLSFNILHKKNFSLTDKFDWEIGYGAMFEAQNASFADWKHFAGSKKLCAISDMASGYKGFVMFDSYRLSTNEWYANIAVHYQSQSLLIKRIPAFRNWLYTEELFLKSAIIGGRDVYSEIGYGIGHILLILRTTIFASFVNKDFDSVNLRMSISIPKLNDK